MAAKKSKTLHPSVQRALNAASAHIDTSALERMLTGFLDFEEWDDLDIAPNRTDRNGRTHVGHPKVDDATLWLVPVLAAFHKRHKHPMSPDAPLHMVARIERGRLDACLDVPGPLAGTYRAAITACRSAATDSLRKTRSGDDVLFMVCASTLADLVGCPDAARACDNAKPTRATIVDATSDLEVVARTIVKPKTGFNHVVSFENGVGKIVRFKVGEESMARTKVIATFEHTQDARFVYSVDVDGNVVRRRPGRPANATGSRS